MASVRLSEFSKWFWKPEFWLPANATWEDLVPENEDEYYPRFEDMFLPSLGIGVCLLVVRFVYARYITFLVLMFLLFQVAKFVPSKDGMKLLSLTNGCCKYFSLNCHCTKKKSFKEF